MTQLWVKFLSVIFLLTSWLAADVRIPSQPQAPVTDLSQTLSQNEIAHLNQQIIAAAQQSSNQIAILLVPSTAPYEIADFSFKVFNTWGLGQKNKNNGVLIVVATQDRRSFIATGKGLEGAIPDAYARRIVDYDMIPSFRLGSYAVGLEAGIQRLIKLSDPEYKPQPEDAPFFRLSGPSVKKQGFSWWQILLAVFFLIVILSNARKGDGVGSLLNGALIISSVLSSRDHDGGGFGDGGGGFGGGSSGGGGAGGSW